MISMSSSTSESVPSDLLDILKKDPVKRGLVLQLIAQERDGFNAYKKRNPKLKGPPSKNEASPLKKLQKTSRQCNSPTTLLRKRALQKRNQEIASESSSSELSEAQAESSSFPSVDDPQAAKVPFEQLLEGVIAYVEVKRNNLDKSSGIKAIMKWMGAKIKDTFTSDVTHVVFKDGSFHTYQKAKLMKIHLVSVLWLEAIRKHNVRVPEKNYPAFGGEHCDNNISMLCSQLQKDYEDIVKDEKRRSLASQLPLSGRNSKNSLENRRRTLMTPSTSTASFQTATEKQSPPSSKLNDIDEEVENISSKNVEKSFVQISSPELTSDESDCGGVVDGYSSRHLKDKFFQSISQCVIDETPTKVKNSNVSHATVENSDLLTHSAELEQSTKTVINRGRNTAKDKRKDSNMSLTPIKNDISTKADGSVKVGSDNKVDTIESDQSNSLFLRPVRKNRRKTINVISDMVLTPRIDNRSPKIIIPIQKESLQKNLLEDLNKSNLTKTSSEKSTNISNDEQNILKTIQDLADNTIMSLGVTHNDSDKSNKISCLTRNDKENLSSGSLRTTMSSLRLSDDNYKMTNKNQKKNDAQRTSLDESNDSSKNAGRKDWSHVNDLLENSAKENATASKKSSGVAIRKSRTSSSSKKLDDLFDKVAKEKGKSDQKDKESESGKCMDRMRRAHSVTSKISGSSKKQPAVSDSENSDEENNNTHTKNDSPDMLDNLLKRIIKLSQETDNKQSVDGATNRKSRASSATSARTSKEQPRSDSESSEEQNDSKFTKIEIRRESTSSGSINRKIGVSSVTSKMASSNKNSKKSARSTNTRQSSESSEHKDNSNSTKTDIRRKRSSSSSTDRKTLASSVTPKMTDSSNTNQPASDNSINQENDSTKSVKKDSSNKISGRSTNTRQSRRASSVTSRMSSPNDDNRKRTASPTVSENDFRRAKRRNTMAQFTINLPNLNVTSHDKVTAGAEMGDSSEKFSTNKARDRKDTTLSVVATRKSSRSSSLFSRPSFQNDSERTTTSSKESRIDESSNSSCSLVVNVNHSENIFGDSTQSPSKKDESNNSPLVRLAREINASSSDDSGSPKKLRKLFNPTDFSPKLSMTDAREREEYRLAQLNNKKQKNKTLAPAGDFVDPNNVLISRRSSLGKSAQKNSSSTAAVGAPSCSSQDESEEEFVNSKSAVTVKENKKNKKARRRSSVRAAHNSDDDEYILEHEPVTHNNNENNEMDLRRSRRISTSQKSINYKLSSTSSETTDSDRLMLATPTSVKRRSTLEFQNESSSMSQKKRRIRLDRSQVTSIVCTKFHRPEVLQLEEIVNKLGRFEVEYVVTKRTSHLLVGEPKRTINLLRAIARGCWILKREWLIKSNRAGRWLNEEEFELTEYSPAVQQNRLQRQAFGPDYSMDIFQNCGYIYISKNNTSPNSVELKELVELCKGKLTTISRNAIISVGEILKQETVICVDPRWILDSIVFNKVKPFKNYLMQEVNAPESPHY